MGQEMSNKFAEPVSRETTDVSNSTGSTFEIHLDRRAAGARLVDGNRPN